MKKKGSLTALLTLLLVGISSAAAQIPASKSPADRTAQWKLYAFEKDRFEARFPLEPQLETRAGSRGETTSIYRQNSPSAGVALQIRVTTLPAKIEEMVPVGEFMSEMLKIGLAAIKDQNPRVVDEQEIIQDGKPGRVYRIEADGGFAVRMKFVVSGERFYYLFAGTEKKLDANAAREAERMMTGFLDSFRLL